jgi:hypothetical protein
MRRFIVIAPLLALLNGCWWDTAPEVYQVELQYNEAGASKRSETFICDFRGQSSTRICRGNIAWKNEHFRLEANPENPAYDKIAKVVDSVHVQNKFADLTTEYVSFSIDAHARKEGRYQLLLSLHKTVQPAQETTATDDKGRPVIIATDAQLRESITVPYKSAYDDLAEAVAWQFNLEATHMILPGVPYWAEEKGDLFSVTQIKPLASPSVSITWTPLDEDDLSKTDKVS